MTEPIRAPDPFSDAPWDDDDPATSQPDGGGSPASRGVLRASLILLIVSTAVMFLAAVASNNAVPSSTNERIALAVHRASMFAMLLSFVGILFAYRLPMLAAYLSAKREQRAASGTKQSLLTAELSGLLLASAVLLAWVWGSILFGFPLLHLITYWLLFVIAAMLANMILLHTGALRSFAIGMLLSLLLILFTWRSIGTMLIFAGGRFGGGLGFSGSDENRLFIVFGVEITMSVAAGLVCACYYEFVAKLRSQADDAAAVAQSP